MSVTAGPDTGSVDDHRQRKPCWAVVTSSGVVKSRDARNRKGAAGEAVPSTRLPARYDYVLAIRGTRGLSWGQICRVVEITDQHLHPGCGRVRRT